MKRALYCGGAFIELSQWLKPARPSRGLASHFSQFRDRSIIGTHSGRSAIALACHMLGIKPGDEVLVPAYNCGTELDALLFAGAKLIGYPISRKCEMNLQDLVLRKTSRTRAVYIIHYFGWEQPLEGLKQWCQDQGLLLLEDCALALFSENNSNSIGRTGDASIFSFPKTLGTNHGGLLSMARSPTSMPDLIPAGPSVLINELMTSARTTASQAMGAIGIRQPLVAARNLLRKKSIDGAAKPHSSDIPSAYYFNPEKHANRAIHPWIWAVLNSTSSEFVVHQRRSNYMTLASALAKVSGVKLLYPGLPGKVCPLSLPLLVENRNARVTQLQSKGIAALPWWAGFHSRSLDWTLFPDACFLKNNVLTLPVHHKLENRHMLYIAELFQRSVKESANPFI